jgi:hypothetical protein
MPVNVPVDASTVPTDAVLLLHVPPNVVLASDSVPDTQIEVPPVIGAGNGFTLNEVIRKQPDGSI